MLFNKRGGKCIVERLFCMIESIQRTSSVGTKQE